MESQKPLKVSVYRGTADARGQSFSLAGALRGVFDAVKDCHVGSINPGAVRGNHYHSQRTEVILVVFFAGCSIHWRDDSGVVHSTSLAGQGVAVVEVGPGCAHAVRNDGDQKLFIVSLTDGSFDASSGETVRSVVIES